MLKLIYFLERSPKVCNTLRLPPDSRSRSDVVGESAKNVLVSCRLLACSRLRDSGEKSFSKKKWKKRAGAGERRIFSRRHRPLSQVARVLFSLCSFNTSPLYYLRAWHRLVDCQLWMPAVMPVGKSSCFSSIVRSWSPISLRPSHLILELYTYTSLGIRSWISNDKSTPPVSRIYNSQPYLWTNSWYSRSRQSWQKSNAVV